MIPIRKLHYEIKLSLDKIDNLQFPNLLPNELDTYIWKGTKEWFINNVNLLEVQSQITNKLSKYHVLEELISPITSVGGKYQINLDDLNNYFKVSKLTAIITHNNCNKEVTCFYKESGDTDITYNNPSYTWGILPYSINRNDNNLSSIYLYTDGKFTINSIKINYLKLPVEPFYGGYDSINGIYQASDAAVDSDVDEIYLQELLVFILNEIKKDLRNE